MFEDARPRGVVLDAVWRVVLSAVAAASWLWLDEVLSTVMVRPSRVVFALVIQLSCIQCFTDLLIDTQDIRVLHFAITPLPTMLVTPNVRAACMIRRKGNATRR